MVNLTARKYICFEANRSIDDKPYNKFIIYRPICQEANLSKSIHTSKHINCQCKIT